MNAKLTVITPVLLGMTAFSLQAYGTDSDKSLVRQFNEIDADHSGYLSKAEIRERPVLTRYMNVYGYGNFEMGDIDSDGVLSRDEFMAAEEDLPAE